MKLRRITLLLVLPILLHAGGARAQGIPDFLTARGIATGATRAFAMGADAIFLNPAGLALTRVYQLELDYGHDAAPSSELTSGNGLVASIADSASNNWLATGFSYRYVDLNVAGIPSSGSVYDVALATSLKIILLGIHGTYFNYSGQGAGNHITGDIGGMVPIGPLVFSCVGFNLISVNSIDAPLGVSGGVAYTDKSSLSFGGDVRWQFLGGKTYHTYSVGAEYMLAQAVPLRAGFLVDGTVPTDTAADTASSAFTSPIATTLQTSRFLTLGTGFYISSFGLDATYRRDITTNSNAWIFAVKLFIGGTGQ